MDYFFFIILALFILPSTHATNAPPLCHFDSIYQFGDSLADTGNLIRIPGARMNFRADQSPYGQTYFGKPTGRYSDGRVILDFIAVALKLPFIEPYMNPNGSFAHGVNFAVAGATALDNNFFAERNVAMSPLNSPVSAQLRWLDAHVHDFSRASKPRLETALFIFGEFGGNDYVSALAQGKSVGETQSYVPHAVNAVIHGVKRIVKLGAKRVVVPGTLPFGCLPAFLTNFASSDPKDYDEFGCLKTYNDLSNYHNVFLKTALSTLNRELDIEGVVIVYGDYYGAFREVLRLGSSLGFDNGSLLKACCGTGGKYNYDNKKPCGSENVPVCPNPTQFMSWDGIHLTDESNHRMSEILIHQVLSKIKC